jgi:hypothetical protein
MDARVTSNAEWFLDKLGSSSKMRADGRSYWQGHLRLVWLELLSLAIGRHIGRCGGTLGCFCPFTVVYLKT